MHKAQCICGNIKVTVNSELPEMHACHCSLCRKSSGHYGVGVDVDRAKVEISGKENITWYQTSDWARRGFCKTCGTPLFFDPLDKEKIKWIGITMGCFENPTGTKLVEHIFVKDKGDYYELNDGLPQFETIPPTA